MQPTIVYAAQCSSISVMQGWKFQNAPYGYIFLLFTYWPHWEFFGSSFDRIAYFTVRVEFKDFLHKRE